MTRSCHLTILLLGIPLGLPAWTPKLLTPGEFLDYYINAAALSYFVNIKQCTNDIYSNITMYSYGDVITNGYVTSYPTGKFILTYSSDREVDGRHLNLTGPAIRSTGIALDDSPDVLVGMNDINPATGSVMDQSQVVCKNEGNDQGGFQLFAQTPKGTLLTTLKDVQMSLMTGGIVYYVFDIYHCVPVQPLDAKQYYAGRIVDFRINKKGAMVFSDRLLGLGFITVFNVELTSETNVTIDMYMYSRQTSESTHLANKKCIYGDTLKIYKHSQ
ncbi:uncharacterized protein [Haliotis cracherodii]|uniref:uncharacterized protein isoform X2 n=1 Tax=Haliotis cracherodii TaxID=6455 RepID=UPI0039EBF100